MTTGAVTTGTTGVGVAMEASTMSGAGGVTRFFRRRSAIQRERCGSAALRMATSRSQSDKRGSQSLLPQPELGPERK